LEILYFNPLKPDKSRRKISVLRVKAEPKRTLIEAWCDSSKGIRTFNLAQIEELEIKDEAIEEIDLQDKEERISAVVQAPADSYFAIENQAQLHQIAEGYEIEIFQPEWLVRKVLAEAGSAVLRSPSMMATRVRELASRSLALYQ
jgi:predicted DNA-binding transcriptional regulator YafY